LKDKFYKILGLSNGASEEDIKKAYRKLAMLHHPDKNKNEKSHQKFIKINEAYAALTDENYTAKTINNEPDAKAKNNLSEEELKKRMEWATNYSRMKNIKESRINYISYIQLRKSPMRKISLYVSIISVLFSSLLILDYWLIPFKVIEGSLITKEFNSNDNLYHLTFKNLNSFEINQEFVFKTDLEDLRKINRSCQLSNNNNNFNFHQTNIFNQLLTINCFSGVNEVSFFNKGSFFQMIYLFIFIFSLPLITLISWGPNTVHILSSYLFTYLAIFGFFILIIVLIQ
jgi:curved DNA-binding protein CbpA